MDNKVRRRKVSSSSDNTSRSRRNKTSQENVVDLDSKRNDIKRSNNTSKNKSSRVTNKEEYERYLIRKRIESIKRFFRSVFRITLVFSILTCIIGGFSISQIHKRILNDGVVIDDISLRSHYVASNIASSSEIPQYLKDAIVSIEDERFYSHNGVDVISLGRAVLHNVFYDTTQGGSTIDMQVSKNLLTTLDQTYERKFKDIYNSIKMNQSMTKDEILTTYLNNIYLGKSAYGVKDGAFVYFGKDLSELSLAECALLAGITNNPIKYKEFNQAKSRQEVILMKMHELGYISDEEYRDARREDILFKSEIE